MQSGRSPGRSVPPVTGDAPTVAEAIAGKAQDVACLAAEMAALAPVRGVAPTTARLRSPSSDLLAKATQFIRDNPLTALLLGAALGLLLAEMTQRE
jgi:ElaB/YqjD/DUF883 family membrane-anchored ribosome-binding protein